MAATPSKRAAAFAALAHAGQVRKYTAEPFIVHPEEAVAALVASVPHTESMLAAWLHDVAVTLREIQAEFGPEIAAMVEALTDTPPQEGSNRAGRKARDRERLARACPGVQTVKLADLIDNSRTSFAFDHSFGRVYLPEKQLMHKVLQAGDATLLRQARDIAARGMV